MLAMLLVLAIAVGNFALGFGLAVHLGHGPAWAGLPSPNAIRSRLQSVLKRKAKSKSEGH